MDDIDNIKCEFIPEEMIKYDLSFKIIIIGDSGVGKSSLTLRATKNQFQDYYNATVGFEFFSQNIKIDDTIIKLQMWDTCGQEIYRSLISSFYKNSSLAMIMYSIEDEESFRHLDYWIKEIKNNSNPDIKIILIGNKVDLEDKRTVSKEEEEKFAKENGIEEVYETSAKTGFNAKNIFCRAAQILYKEHLNYKQIGRDPSLIRVGTEDLDPTTIPIPKEQKKKGCC